jgi:hypothetical protein
LDSHCCGFWLEEVSHVAAARHRVGPGSFGRRWPAFTRKEPPQLGFFAACCSSIATFIAAAAAAAAAATAAAAAAAAPASVGVVY